MSKLHLSTYLVMLVFMFIGGASGSTAGGIKVNTIGAMFAFIKSFINKGKKTTIFKKSLSNDIVMKSFIIFTFSICIVFTGVLIMSLTEKTDMIKLLFEVVSAFGTVGLSTGITPFLSLVGKSVIIMLMIIGKIGPITVLLIITGNAEKSPIEYPDAGINIG